VELAPEDWQPRGSLAHLLVWRAHEQPGFPFLWVDDEGPWSIGVLAAEASRVTRQLTDMGIGEEQLVLVRLGNDERFLSAVMAVWSLGAVAMPMHPSVPALELARVCQVMAPTAVVAAAGDAVATGCGLPVALLARTGTTYKPGWPDPASFRAPPDVAGSARALVLLTSGSTGAPKGVVLTHDNAWTTVRATVSAFRSDLRPSPFPERPRPPNLVANPLSHTAGMVRLLFALYVGRPIVLLGKFSSAAAHRAIEAHGIDNLTINPTMMRMLLEDPSVESLGNVRFVSSSAAPLPEALRAAFEERFGVPVLQGYGQTESFGAVAIESAKDVLAGRRRPGSVGRPLPTVELRVVTEEGGEAEPGMRGEICVRSPSATHAYLGDASVPVDREGWLHTGDLGYLDDDGYLFVVGRKRNIIISGGFNVVPEEIESALNELPGVRDAAVIGVPDERLGEIPVAVVEATDDPDALMALVRQRMVPYKRPRRIVVVDQLPRLPTGKPDKVALQAVVEAGSPGR
jgi:long-chain acyl-CoA synthetase